MKLHILSDIHLEFGKWMRDHDINQVDADVTILAGDIGEGLQGLEWALTIDRPVVYVMGNHEFYGQQSMETLWRQAREMVAGTHVHLLENESVLINDPHNPGMNIRFLGATLWTDFCALGPERQDECMAQAARSITDYNAISITRRGPTLTEYGVVENRLTPRKVLALHHESRDFLEFELERQPDPLGVMNTWTETVVVTHHAPAVKSLGRTKAGTHIDAAYASHLDYLIAKSDLWVHGHIHKPMNYKLAPGIGRVVSNPRGYVGHGLVRGFNPNFLVEI